MTVRIGHASLDENNKAKGGKAGDQTYKEIAVQDWYLLPKGWSAVFRAKATKTAEKIARAVEQACSNDNIGYDQGQRTTLYTKAKNVKWELSKITEKCECDCSSLVSVCVNAAGISVSKDMYTGNQKKVLSATGEFEILEDSKYLTKPNYLRRGDILLGTGHTAIVVSSSDNGPIVENAKSFSKSFAHSYYVTASSLNVRCGAGITKSVLKVIPKGTKLTCYGYYTKVLGATWLYVQFNSDNKRHTGFVSMRYLAK